MPASASPKQAESFSYFQFTARPARGSAIRAGMTPFLPANPFTAAPSRYFTRTIHTAETPERLRLAEGRHPMRQTPGVQAQIFFLDLSCLPRRGAEMKQGQTSVMRVFPVLFRSKEISRCSRIQVGLLPQMGGIEVKAFPANSPLKQPTQPRGAAHRLCFPGPVSRRE